MRTSPFSLSPISVALASGRSQPALQSDDVVPHRGGRFPVFPCSSTAMHLHRGVRPTFWCIIGPRTALSRTTRRHGRLAAM